MAISKALRYQILRRDNHTCQACGRTAPEVKLQVDHVIPEALGGQTVPENLRTLCADCNGGKSATPPDAAQVAAVNADAVRWAEAMKVATAGALADIKARAATHRKFDKAWKSWPETERPVGWKQSVDSIVAAGLPVEVLLDCIDRAMSNRRIRPWDVFRYMCGIAWSRVTEIQEAARAVAEPRRPSPSTRSTLADDLDPLERDRIAVPAYDEGRMEVAAAVLATVDRDDKVRLLQVEYDAAVAEGDELGDINEAPTATYIAARAAVAAMREVSDHRAGLEAAANRVIDSLPDGLRRRCDGILRVELNEDGPPFDYWDVLRWTLFHLAGEFAKGNVDLAPEAVC